MQNKHATAFLCSISALWASVLKGSAIFQFLACLKTMLLKCPLCGSYLLSLIPSPAPFWSTLPLSQIILPGVAVPVYKLSVSLCSLSFNPMLSVTHFGLVFSLLISLHLFHIWIIAQWLRFTLSLIVKIFRKRMCLHTLPYLYGTIEYKWLLSIMHTKMASYLTSLLLF